MATATPEPPFKNPCVVYKPFRTDGGLERYLTSLASVLNAPVYTTSQSIEPDHAGDIRIHEFGHRTWGERVLSRLPFGSAIELVEYENFTVPREYDAVITIGEPAKAVIHQPHQYRLHMLNMPPRWLFDLGPGRFDAAPVLLRTLKRLYQSALRVHDVSTVHRIDDFVVPSETIARRLETYYNRTATAVIHPPVDTDRYYYNKRQGYLLYLGRLAETKGISEIVDVLSNTEYRLKVAGTGPMGEELRRRAASNVEFLGYVSEERKRELLANCDGLVFNSDREAFGIVPIEAFASGKPVIGVDEGYTSYQIKQSINGLLFERGRLKETVDRFYDKTWDEDAIQQSAVQYDTEEFRESWQGLLKKRR